MRLSDAIPVLKKVIVGSVRDNLKTNAVAWYFVGGSLPRNRQDAPYQEPKRMNAEVISMTNNTATIPLRLGRNAGIYAVTESDNSLVAPYGPSYFAGTVSARYLTGTFRVSLQAMSVMEGTGSIVGLLKSQAADLAADYVQDLNRQFYGNGAGAIARVASNTAAGSTTLTLSKPNFIAATTNNNDIDFADYLPVGSIVLVGSVTAEVTAVGSNSLTVSPGILTAANTIYKSNAAGTASLELDGLSLAVRTSATTYLSLSDGRWAAASVTGQTAGSNTLTEAMLDTAYIASAKVGKPDALFMNQTCWRKYASLLSSLKRYSGQQTYYGGTPGLEYQGGNASVLLDYDCPDDAAYVLSSRDWQLLQWREFDLEEGTNGNALRVAGTLNYEVVGAWFGNIATGKRKANAISYNMTG